MLRCAGPCRQRQQEHFTISSACLKMLRRLTYGRPGWPLLGSITQTRRAGTKPEEKLKAVNEAYDTLKRSEKRLQYDETPPVFEAGYCFTRRTKGTQQWSDRADDFQFDGHLRTFSHSFSGRRPGRQHGPRPGRDLKPASIC